VFVFVVVVKPIVRATTFASVRGARRHLADR